jgi:glycosyltransferase involved in cell wall biosynthesis/phosphohistidine swiveling domain-containing protein
MLRTLVLVPVFNEERTAKYVLEQIREHTSAEILVVNDGSTDQSLTRIKECDIDYIIDHKRNAGCGGALISGFNFAVEHNYDIIVTMDADGQHEPQYIPEFLAAINGVDIVVGSRYLPESERKSQPPRDREIANQTLTKLVRKYVKYNITDSASGFRAYRVSALRKLRITEKGYAWPFQIWVQASKARLNVKEIPISLVYLDYKRSSHGEFSSMKEAMAKAERVMKVEMARDGHHKDNLTKNAVIWTRDNVGEVVPDVITPLSWSVLDPMVNSAFLYLGHRLGLSVGKTKFFDCLLGRVYLNINAYKSIMQSLNPLGNRRSTNEMPKLVWNTLQSFILMCLLPLQIRRSLAAVPKEVSKLKKLNPKELSSHDILNRTEGLQLLLKSCMRIHITGTMMGQLFVSLLKSLVTKWGGRYSNISYSTLLTGLSGMKSAEPGLELWKLSQKVSLKEKIREVFVNHEPSKILGFLATFKEGKDFAAEIEDFISEYGSFSMQEFELSYPRWENDPTFILETLRSYILPGNFRDPLAFEKRQRALRLEATEKLKKELSNFKHPFHSKRLIFTLVLSEAQRYVLWRENMKQNFVLAYSQLRRFYGKLASRFVDSGVLEEEGDLYFLTAKEIRWVVDGRLKSEKLGALVSTRKRERTNNLKSNFPKLIETCIGLNRKIREVMEERNPKSVVALKGIGCSVGRATGKAQVVLDPVDYGKFKKGGILVAPFTSPSWTPLFLIAGAIVTEFGGVSSHGAIVAREYGIPCVTSVENATKVIKNGEILTVDGEKGIVYIGSHENKEYSKACDAEKI